MKPLTFTTTVDRPRQQVWDYLADLRRHEAFTDHFLKDFQGEPGHVHVRVDAMGRSEVVEITVVEEQAPARSVERTVGANGKRTSRGTYRFEEDGPSRTRVHFELELESMPAMERPLVPFTRMWLRRKNTEAMERLPKVLEAAIPAA